MRLWHPSSELAVLAVVVATSACAVRVGAGTKPSYDPPPACVRVGDERKLPFGAGSQAFSWVWDAGHYVVAYADSSAGNGDIYLAKLSASGDAMGAPVAVENSPAHSDLPNLLKTDQGFLVVWQEGTAGQAVVARAASADATPTGERIPIASTQSQQSRPVLARAPGGAVAVSWMDSFQGKGGVQLAMLDAAGTMHGPQRVSPGDVDGWPWLAGDDHALGLVWSDEVSTTYDVRFSPVDLANLTAAGPRSLRDHAGGSGLLPRMVRTSFGFLAAWEDTRDRSNNEIYMALLDAAGTRLGGGLVEEPGSGDANWPNIAWTGDQAGIVYYQWRGGRPQIFMSFVDAAGARVAGRPDLQVSNGSEGSSRYPDVVWTGSEFGVMYVDDRTGAPALWLQRVGCTP